MTAVPTRLFRGANLEMHRKLSTGFQPKALGKPFSSAFRWGDTHAAWGVGAVYGESPINEVILHQWKQKGLPTSGISTTPYFERARIYALHAGVYREGVVYEIDPSRLAILGIVVYRVCDIALYPAVPDDDEYVLVAADNGLIPLDVVVHTHIVVRPVDDERGD